jgi:hypothetical protein
VTELRMSPMPGHEGRQLTVYSPTVYISKVTFHSFQILR